MDDLRGVLRRPLLQRQRLTGGERPLGRVELLDVLRRDPQVLRRFEAAEHLDADAAFEPGGARGALAQQGVQVASLVGPLQQPRLVVDAGGAEPGVLDVEAVEPGEVVGGALGDGEPPLVDVEEGEVQRSEVVEAEGVGGEPPGGDDAAGPDGGDAGHGPMVGEGERRLQ
ncbi:hypothetical protein BJ968_000098 [Kineococcus aurantiacus]|uniref:Uncharacterized protein n=1 Tax=Kineococcus aurantiacus TaxID=37633 RepID=A0A7Y9ASE7_9ACTN|nr:hypothetical protein [Kineococcus aurantiacus]